MLCGWAHKACNWTHVRHTKFPVADLNTSAWTYSILLQAASGKLGKRKRGLLTSRHESLGDPDVAQVCYCLGLQKMIMALFQANGSFAMGSLLPGATARLAKQIARLPQGN